jgi:hypothetical protein
VGLFLARHLEKYIESDLIPEHFPVNQFVEAAALCWGSRFFVVGWLPMHDLIEYVIF